MTHPWEMSQLAEQRRHDLLAAARPLAAPAGPGLAGRLRRSLGLGLIAAGERLAGPRPAARAPQPLPLR